MRPQGDSDMRISGSGIAHNGRQIVAEFHKRAGGRLELFAITTLTKEVGNDGRAYLSRTQYDVDLSRKYGYIFDQSGFGGGSTVAVSGIYFASSGVSLKETPTQLVASTDKPPFRSKATKVIRQRNRTRRLRSLPRSFDLRPGWDLMDWLENNAIQSDSVWCSSCRDTFPEDSLCEHCWWCDQKCWWSTPSERCEHPGRDCHGDPT